MEEQQLQTTGMGLKSTLIAYIAEGKIDEARKMFTCNSEEAEKAIREYDPSQHAIMDRMDKVRTGKNPYETNKLPRAWQRIINETNVFFMFGNPINFTLNNETSEARELQKYFRIFKEFAEDIYFHERMREAKRVAGSETESAKLYSYYVGEDGDIKIRCQVLANSKEQKLYTLFNKYGDMVAFACGYFMQTLTDEVEEHFDIYTADRIYLCSKVDKALNWAIENDADGIGKANVIGKIPVIYYHQNTEWDGIQRRIERDEWVDSKRGDIVEYFGDPYLKISRDIAGNRFANAEEVGKVIALDGENSVFEFVAPPDSSSMIKEEKTNLKTSIQQDTFSPDWTYDSIMGLGTLSGEAMRRINLPGYVKRATRAEIYNELIMRDIHLLITILRNIVYIGDAEIREGLRRLRIGFSYQDPFVGGIEDNSTEIATLIGCGAMSIRSGIEMNRNVDDKDAEEQRIWEEKERLLRLEAQINAEQSSTTKKEEE